MKILVVVAHPDDEVLGMGGTILKHAQKGDKIKVVYLASGITSRRSANYKNSASYEHASKNDSLIKKQIQELKKDAEKSCKILKINEFKFYDLPDNEMDTIGLLKIVKIIEKEIEETKPDKVYTHHYDDLNVDHRMTFNATLTACRPFGSTIKELVSFEVLSSTEWNYPSSFNPNYFINIQGQLSKKIKAMQMYKNEIRSFPHPRSSKNIKTTAEKWGSISGNLAAEAFEIIRRIDK